MSAIVQTGGLLLPEGPGTLASNKCFLLPVCGFSMCGDRSHTVCHGSICPSGPLCREHSSVMPVWSAQGCADTVYSLSLLYVPPCKDGLPAHVGL